MRSISSGKKKWKSRKNNNQHREKCTNKLYNVFTINFGHFNSRNDRRSGQRHSGQEQSGQRELRPTMRTLKKNNPAVNVEMFRIRKIQKIASPVLNHKINGELILRIEIKAKWIDLRHHVAGLQPVQVRPLGWSTATGRRGLDKSYQRSSVAKIC